MSLSLDNKTIYEIFRACRLCGAGGGYKMPIIPSVVGFDCADIDLRQKIRECVQIEVNQDDKMPPLICELCVDKVNDFYEFLAMCRDTNVKTRRRLGLPDLHSQNLEADNCILGVTEPVYQEDDDEDDAPLARPSRPVRAKVKREGDDRKREQDRVKSLKKELENLIKQETSARESRSSRSDRFDLGPRTRGGATAPQTPARETRQATDRDDASRLQVIEIDDDDESDSPLVQPVKRSRERSKEEPPNKKLKITIKVPPPEILPPAYKTRAKPGPKCSKREEPPPAPVRPSRQTTSAPGPKLAKTTTSPSPGPKSAKTPTPSSPGPKSAKRPTTPSPGPKSAKRQTSPSPGPKSAIKPTFPAGPKSAKRQTSPSPTPKSFRRPSHPYPGPKSAKNSTPSPGPKSAKRSTSPTPAPRASRTLSLLSSKSPKILPPPVLRNSRTSQSGPKSSKRLSSPVPSTRSTKPPAAGKDPPASGAKGKPGATPSAGEYVCAVCASVFQSPQGHSNHLRAMHTVRYTKNDLACNPCGKWFSTAEEVTAHHKQHKSKNKPYICRGCWQHYRSPQDYNQHAADTVCVPWTEVPDVKCAQCWRLFPTRVLLDEHRCAGADSRPGGKCSKCNKTYAMLKNLKKHESSCTIKKKGANPLSALPASIRSRLLPARVVVARCDELLAKNKRGRYLVCGLPEDFGLDPNCIYPYRAFVRVKQEPLSFDGMVSINKDVRDEFYIEEDYVHWDSDNSSSDEESLLVGATEKKKKVASLTTLTLKTLYSKRCLGKVPRKLRKVRTDKFDAFFNQETEFGDNVRDDITNIINNLGDDNDANAMIGGFSLSDIKLTDVKSISEIDNVSAGNNEMNGEVNYESDSLLENQSQVVSNEDNVDSESMRNVDNGQSTFTLVNKHIMNPIFDNGSETDASIEDNTTSQGTKQIYDEKDTASENSLNISNKIINNLNYDEKDTASENSLNIVNNLNYDEKDTALENSLNIDNKIVNNLNYDEKDTASENSLNINNRIVNNLNYDEKDTASENSLNINNRIVNNLNYDEKDTASEDSPNIDSEIVNDSEILQNGNVLETITRIENNFGVTVNETDLINDIDELYDKKLMEELNAQIDDKSNTTLDKSEKLLLDNLVTAKDVSLGLDNISDEEFNFDT